MIVCLMGPSASGKSTLAKYLEAQQPQRFARVPVDYFFVPRADNQTPAEYFASPLAYDWVAVDHALDTRIGEQRSTPDCDFERFVRRSQFGGLPIREAPVYVLDGMRPHPRCDFVVMFDLDSHEQRRRLIERDARWGTTVADRDENLAATFDAGCAELPRTPDLRLSATDSIERNAVRVIDALSEHYLAGRTVTAMAPEKGA